MACFFRHIKTSAKSILRKHSFEQHLYECTVNQPHYEMLFSLKIITTKQDKLNPWGYLQTHRHLRHIKNVKQISVAISPSIGASLEGSILGLYFVQAWWPNGTTSDVVIDAALPKSDKTHIIVKCKP